MKKKCYKCKQEKERIDFGRDPKASDGLKSYCKKCDVLVWRENKARKKEGTIIAF